MVMFDVTKQSSYEVLMLSNALFCRYAQAYDAQQADQSKCRRVCPVFEDGQVLLTVEGHWQRGCELVVLPMQLNYV